MILIIGVRFRKSGKVYYFSPNNMDISKGDHVIVETARGVEYGTVVLAPREVTDDKVIQPLKPVIRVATEEDDTIYEENNVKEKEAFDICLEKISKHQLAMKLIDSEYTFDRNKLLFYFTADGRIDFRDLVKDLASVFRTRIELRQIGVRDETKLLGGIGICGRPLCCHTYLSDFAPVSIKMAKEQNLSLNPAKISGVCGRLMCCLKNEQEAYEYLNSTLPGINDKVRTFDGYEGTVQSVNVLKQNVKIIITKDDDDKEIKDYHVSELSFERKRGGQPTAAPVLPDEELDENALKELQQMEQSDLEDMAEEQEQQPKKKQYKKPYNKNQKKNNYRDKNKDSHKDFQKDTSDGKHHENKGNKRHYNNHQNHKYGGGNGGYTNQNNTR